ncbi:MAG: MBL fold metallo-hydrolase [Clostridiales bacterium]|nr:MBL fold metallo-hydrolase [Clostridiales bacterium]
MKIIYLGHSCFKFEKNGFAMIIDPYKTGSVPGYAPLKETANQVISSHKHADHFGLNEVKLSVTRADTPFMVSFIESYHDDKEGALRGFNNVIIVDVDGLSIVHMGDIGCELTDEQVERIRGCDVLLIPVGGFYTIDAEQAKRYVELIDPSIAIPMHYRGDGFGYDEIGTVEAFTELFDKTEEIGSELTLEGKPEGHKVIVMRGAKINV